MTSRSEVLIIGAGIGGLSAAIRLAAAGHGVTVLERQDRVGGKARSLAVGRAAVAAGPTVFTLRHVFEDIFALAGTSLEAELTVEPLDLLARHAWPDGSQLDLFHDPDRSADAISAFAGGAAAGGFRRFSAEAAHIWTTLAPSFVHRQKVGPLGLTWRLGLRRLADLQACRPYETLWSALGDHFRDPRLRQLFARYATYTGASPFAAPATLMLIAHVEAMGVWRISGGIASLAAAMARLAQRMGVDIQTGAEVASIRTEQGRASGIVTRDGREFRASAIICNADPAALADGLFGPSVRRATRAVSARHRSLSAFTLLLHGPATGFPLAHHSVFFSSDYRAEFDRIAAGSLPDEPTTYICSEDRSDSCLPPADGAAERFQFIINAPALGDRGTPSEDEVKRCETRMFSFLQRFGLSFPNASVERVTVAPMEYARLFPSTGGALYGRASHGWAASFLRPGSRSRVPGLYLAGGATHPGAGVPMAAISGRLAAEALMADRASTPRFQPAAMPGGMPTPSPTTAATA